MLILSKIAALLGCSCEASDCVFTGIAIDSRNVKPGYLFVAILGERFDGYDFIPSAVAQGASAVLCHKPYPDLSIPQLIVSDTVQALGILAKAHRMSCDCKVIALTGSNGKTTVKEMIAAILPKPSHATPGNLNNHIGVPLSVLQLTEAHRYAVFELGANHPHEISYTVDIVSPDVALINNIAPAHIAGFGSIDGVAHAKGEIYQGLSKTGIAVVNDDDVYAHFWDGLFHDKIICRFSREHPADICARDMVLNESGRPSFTLVTPTGDIPVALQVAGSHSVSNALAAAACTYAVGISLQDIAQGLSSFGGVPGRMTFLHGKNNALVIDDTYNANLRSSLTALEVLASRPGRRIFVFGDMGELGSWTEQHHQEIGLAAKHHGIDCLMTCGIHSESAHRAFGMTGRHYLQQEALVHDLLNDMDEHTTILVKGSRSSEMEKIVRQLVG